MLSRLTLVDSGNEAKFKPHLSSTVWYDMFPLSEESARAPNNRTVPILVALSLGYQAVPKGSQEGGATQTAVLTASR